MDKCSKCEQAAKYFVRDGQHIYFACDDAEHLRAHGISPDKWRAVDGMGGTLLATAKMGAAVVKSFDDR